MLVDKSVGSGVPSGVLITPSRQGASGKTVGVHLVNSDLSNAATVNLNLVGFAPGNVTLWQSNGGNAGGGTTSATQASLSGLTLPASCVTIITGTVA